jgi:hypothetical protein
LRATHNRKQNLSPLPSAIRGDFSNPIHVGMKARCGLLVIRLWKKLASDPIRQIRQIGADSTSSLAWQMLYLLEWLAG